MHRIVDVGRDFQGDGGNDIAWQHAGGGCTFVGTRHYLTHRRGHHRLLTESSHLGRRRAQDGYL